MSTHLVSDRESASGQEEASVCLYRFSELNEEWLNEKLSRRLVVGKNEMIGYVSMKKDCLVPAHKHLSEQITIVLKGSMEFSTQGRKIVVKEGESLVIPPNVEHAAVALEDTTELDCFSPLREDWLNGTDQYLRAGGPK